MKAIDSQYALAAAPQDSDSSSLSIALIIVGGTIGFGVFLIAAQIGGSLGLVQAATAIALGCSVLGLLGAATSYIGARTRLSTYLLTQFTFGTQGAKLINVIVALSLIGWYAVICNYIGQTSRQVLLDGLGLDVHPYAMVLLASGLMIYVTIKGFTGIDRLAFYLVPVMVAFLVFAAYRSWVLVAEAPAAPLNLFTFSTAVSAVVGTYIAGAIIQPDYSRFAKSVRGSTVAVYLALGVVYPVILLVSSVPSILFGDVDLLRVLGLLGLVLPAFVLLFFGAWSSNVLCLYSSSLSLATVNALWPLKRIILSIGVVGTAAAYFPVETYLIDFLVILGVTIPPIGAIYLLEGYRCRFRFDLAELSQGPSVRPFALLVWLFSSMFGYFVEKSDGFDLTGVASLDALLAAVVVFGAFAVSNRQTGH